MPQKSKHCLKQEIFRRDNFDVGTFKLSTTPYRKTLWNLGSCALAVVRVQTSTAVNQGWEPSLWEADGAGNWLGLYSPNESRTHLIRVRKSLRRQGERRVWQEERLASEVTEYSSPRPLVRLVGLFKAYRRKRQLPGPLANLNIVSLLLLRDISSDSSIVTGCPWADYRDLSEALGTIIGRFPKFLAAGVFRLSLLRTEGYEFVTH
ncbi:hypothetical protein GALMADRAFT_213289 [Galerina marginata CBS 339.88]|uniref:Uncharacterized protein n=1 Tax=Galerina marginata (strain CBS 339.88) TaxID=685588 RepID=A0A067SQC6_GALM3|nr:hypothetical protein GALMADRAFT_213289 [Galerina marginata CBS 339.88]